MPPVTTLNHAHGDIEERQIIEALDADMLAAYVLTPEGQAAQAAGELDIFCDDEEGMEQDGD